MLIINWGKEMWEILRTPARWHNNFCEKYINFEWLDKNVIYKQPREGIIELIKEKISIFH